MHLFFDFETYSPVDLVKHGVKAYAAHPDAAVICGVFDFVDINRKSISQLRFFGDELIDRADDIWNRLQDLFDSSNLLIAHNISFDLEIYNSILLHRLDMPAIPGNIKPVCTKMRQYFYSFLKNVSLEKAGDIFNLQQRKSTRGKSLIEMLSMPDSNGQRRRNAGLEKEMLDYCVQDVETLKALFFAQQDFAKFINIESNDYLVQKLDLEVNKTGFPVNFDLADAIGVVSEEQKAQAQFEFCSMFNDFSLPSLTQTEALKKFIKDRYNFNIPSFSKKIDGAPEEVQKILNIREKAAQNSLSKSKFILNKSFNNRIYDCLVYCGAHTHRWTGRDFQPQNLPRESNEDEATSFLRNIIATGANSSLILLDYSAIEHRAIFYMAMKFMDAFGIECEGIKEQYDTFFTGADSYLPFTAKIYNLPLESLTKESPERDVGKRAHLSLGYGMGYKEFIKETIESNVELLNKEQLYAVEKRVFEILDCQLISKGVSHDALVATDTYKQYYKKIKDEAFAKKAEDIVYKYRKKYSVIPDLWNYFYNKFFEVVSRGEDCTIDLFWDMKIKYIHNLPFNKNLNCLVLYFPNKKTLFYYNLKIEQDNYNYGNFSNSPQKERMALLIDGKKVTGGLLVQNVIEKLCRELLATHMLEISPNLNMAKIVLHVHDEIVVESADSTLAYNYEIMKVICKNPPKFLPDFPISYTINTTKFYKKA